MGVGDPPPPGARSHPPSGPGDSGCFADGELDQLEAFFTDFELRSYDLDGTERFTGGGAATGTVVLDGAGERDVRVDLTNDDGWRVCGIDITDS